MRKATKTIISFAVILIAGLNFIVPALAQDPFTTIAVGGLTGASGAGLFGSMASMSGINIGWTGATADPMDAMWNVLNPDHVYFSGEKHESSGVGEDVWDYITVDIGDWLDAQSDFIVNFAQTNHVTDNSSGSISNYPRYYGYPFTHGDYGDPLGYAYSGGTYQFGPVTFSIGNSAGDPGYYFYNITSPVSNASSWTNFGINFIGSPIVLAQYRGNVYIGYVYNNTLIRLFQVDFSVTPGNTINWTSDEVDTSVFDGWESAKVKIPSNISQLQTGWTLSDFLDELDRIWSGAGEDNIIIEDGGDTPVPPVPVPDTPIGEVPFDDWVDLWGQGIYQQLENQSDALDLIGSNGLDAIEELESIDTNTEDLVEVAESIDTNIGVGNGILGDIRSLAQSAVNYLEGIAEHVGELVEEIVEGTETLISGILNQIPQAFGVIFGPIKQASSIWHYVVEWIQSIDAPFQFIWLMASGTSYYIILPVYASLAAAVVLAFYKRFGK